MSASKHCENGERDSERAHDGDDQLGLVGEKAEKARHAVSTFLIKSVMYHSGTYVAPTLALFMLR